MGFSLFFGGQKLVGGAVIQVADCGWQIIQKFDAVYHAPVVIVVCGGTPILIHDRRQLQKTFHWICEFISPLRSRNRYLLVNYLEFQRFRFIFIYEFCYLSNCLIVRSFLVAQWLPYFQLSCVVHDSGCNDYFESKSRKQNTEFSSGWMGFVKIFITWWPFS